MSVRRVKKTFGTSGQNYGRREYGQDRYTGNNGKRENRKSPSLDWEKNGEKSVDFEALLNERRMEYMKKTQAYSQKSAENESGVSAEGAQQHMDQSRRKFVLSVLQNAQAYMGRGQSGMNSLLYLGTTFLILHKCGGIRNNLSAAFNDTLDKFDDKNPSFAEKCTDVKDSNRIPYDAATAALDRTAMDLSYYQVMHDPNTTQENRDSIQKAYDEGKVLFDSMCKEDGVDRYDYVRERQKCVAGLVMDDPSKCAVFGIEVGDSVWERFVKGCNAECVMNPEHPTDISDAKVVVTKFRVPVDGFKNPDGSEWLDDSFLKKREPQTLSEHKAALRSFLDVEAVKDIMCAKANSGYEDRNKRGYQYMCRIASRVKMMADDGIPKKEAENMFHDLTMEISGQNGCRGAQSHDAAESVQRQAEEMQRDNVSAQVQYGD